MREMGVRIAIDDFGTGYSSLVSLKQLPVSTIKVDKSFVMNMENDPDDAAIVRSTVALGHNLGLEVVAEGVENPQAWNELEAMGADIAQGYYLSKALRADAVRPLAERLPGDVRARRRGQGNRRSTAKLAGSHGKSRHRAGRPRQRAESARHPAADRGRPAARDAARRALADRRAPPGRRGDAHAPGGARRAPDRRRPGGRRVRAGVRPAEPASAPAGADDPATLLARLEEAEAQIADLRVERDELRLRLREQVSSLQRSLEDSMEELDARPRPGGRAGVRPLCAPAGRCGRALPVTP